MKNCFRRVLAGILGCLIILSVLGGPIAAQTNQPLYDIVIRNGRVLDGAGNPWIAADVAIKDGRFVRIGKIEGKGKQEIDASGKYVSPGWIDMLDQSGSVLQKNGLAESKLLMGVTTGIAGEAGTAVPAEKLAEYFTGLEKSGISMNFGTAYSETQARVAVLGEVSRDPTPEELTRMKALMETAMKAGATGMTTALIYPPASYSKTEELIGERDTPAGRSLYLARPIQIRNGACLECHSTVDVAPKTLIDRYGNANGFGWQLNEIIGAQIVSVPTDVPLARANNTFKVFMLSLTAVFAFIFIVLNVMLLFMVIRPVTQLSKLADEVSLGNLDVEEFHSKSKDEIGALTNSFDRMRKSLVRAFKMLEE